MPLVTQVLIMCVYIHALYTYACTHMPLTQAKTMSLSPGY